MTVILAPPNLLKHPAFSGLKRNNFFAPAGHSFNALGQNTALRFDASWRPPDSDKPRVENNDFPWSWLHEEVFEWIAIGEAVRAAQDTFTMIELGAGYGRWIVAAACFARLVRPELPLKLVGVEADQTHFGWMLEHFKHNKLDPSEHDLFCAAISDKAGTVRFVEAEDPSANYGQYISWPGAEGGSSGWKAARDVEAMDINDLLRRYGSVDLIDMDIQGHEASVVPAGINEMTKRVRRVYIGVHEPLELRDELAAVFAAAGWRNVFNFGVHSQADTEFGPIAFGDGVQYWVNPSLNTNRLSAGQ